MQALVAWLHWMPSASWTRTRRILLDWLDPEQLWFPDLSQALDDPDGLLAAGGDLRPERLLLAYHSGIFPWYDQQQPILWWSPNPRYLVKPSQVNIRRSLKKTLRNGGFEVTFNQQFSRVIQACADREETWINHDMIQAYKRLHDLGWARSVETWRDGELVGGLYGLTMGRFFFGESMFSQVSDASKVAFATLARQLDQWGYAWIDCQVATDHLISLGATGISREQFQSELKKHAGPSPLHTAAPAPWPAHPAVRWGAYE